MDGNSSSPLDAANFVKFLFLLRQRLDKYYPNVEITACMTGNPGRMIGLPLTEMVPFLDSINIMTYDFA